MRLRSPAWIALALVASLLAGCTTPAGVNEDAYPGYRPPPSSGQQSRTEHPEQGAFFAAMRVSAAPRPPIAGEAAYDRYLENATRWAREGLDAEDAARALDANATDVMVAFETLSALRNSTRSSDKEVLAGGPVRVTLVHRYGLHEPESVPNGTAEALVARARAAVEEANATVHAARDRVTAEGRDELLRAQAVLGLAFTQAAAAEVALPVPGRGLAAAENALDARVSAAAVAFWVSLADAASVEGGRPFSVPEDLPERTRRTVAEAEAAIQRARDGPVTSQPILTDVAVGLGLLRALERAGLPEGAWAASQGINETLAALHLVLDGRVPTAWEVQAAWREAAENVRTFRDAQRFDRALATIESEVRPYGDALYFTELLRSYAAVARMKDISEERERVFGDA